MEIETFNVPPEVLNCVKIETAFMHIDHGDYNGAVNLLLEYGDIPFLCYEISYFVRIRPFLLKEISNVCVEILKKLNDHDTFKQRLMFCCFNGSFCLIYQLYRQGIYRIDEIIKGIEFRPLISAAIYFARDIPDFLEYASRLDNYLKWASFMPELFGDNYQLLDEYIECHWKKNTIGYSLKYDDLNMFQQFQIIPGFSWENEIEWSQFEPTLIPKSRSPLSVSALFSAVKVFRFALLNGAKVNIEVLKSSLHGGNYDIIHFSENLSSSISLLLFEAGKFWRNDLFDWIKEKNPEVNIYDSQMAAFSLRNILYQILNGGDINQKSLFNDTPLIKLASMGSLPIIQYFVELGAQVNTYNIVNA